MDIDGVHQDGRIQDGSQDVESELLSRLTTLGTRDKEELLEQFRNIVGNQMSPACCNFYLEMGNWNISTALGAYYDVTSHESLDVASSFALQVIDESKHTSLGAGETFTKTWRLKNTSNVAWPDNLRLKHTKGTNFGHGDVVAVPPLPAGDHTDVSVTMTTPTTEGTYAAEWRLITVAGALVGCLLTINVVVVSPSCLLSLTQRMSSLGNVEDGAAAMMEGMGGRISSGDPDMWTPTRPVSATPFCSPTGHGIFGGGCITTTTNSLSGQLATISEVRRNNNNGCHGNNDTSHITRTNLTQQIETMEEDFANDT